MTRRTRTTAEGGVSLLDHALSAINRGWAVLPLEPRGKRPLGALVPRGVHDATTSPEQARAWWTSEPNANIGIACGGLLVLDLDGPEGANSCAELEERWGALPETYRVTTGRGVHIYFESDTPISNSAAKHGPGLDVRGLNGYVVRAGSIHENGTSYSGNLLAVVPAPSWLVEVCHGSHDRTRGEQPDGAGIPKGSRNQTLLSYAGSLRRNGANMETILAAISGINETCVKPPLDLDELRTIAKNAAKYDVGPNATPTDVGHIELVSAADLAKPQPNIDWLLERFAIAKGRPTILGGYGGLGKTIATRTLALCVATGHSFLQEPVRCGRVAIVDYEMGYSANSRGLQRLSFGLGIELAGLADNLVAAHFPPVYLDSSNVYEEYCRIADGRTLVVVETFFAAHAALKSENDSNARRGLDTLTRISDATGCAFLLTAHEAKPNQTSDTGRARKHALRGSSAIYDACGAVLGISSQGAGILKIEQTKASLGKAGEPLYAQIADCGVFRDGEWEGLRFELTDPPNEVDEYLNAVPPSAAKIRQAIIDALKDGPIATTDLVGRVRGRKTSVLQCIAQMKKADDIVETPGPRGAKFLGLRQGVCA